MQELKAVCLVRSVTLRGYKKSQALRFRPNPNYRAEQVLLQELCCKTHPDSTE